MRWFLLFVFVVGGAVYLGSWAQQGEGEEPKPGHELKVDFSDVTEEKFEYVDRDTLWVDLEEYEGKFIRFIDELSVVWDQFAEYDYAEPNTPEERGKKEKRNETKVKGYKGEFDNQKDFAEDDYFRFDTSLFSCVIDRNLTIPDDEYSRKLYGNYAGSTYMDYIIAVNQYPFPRDEHYKDLPEEEQVKEWDMRMKPKLLYIYGKVVRSVKYGKVGTEEARSMGTKEEMLLVVVWKVKPVTKQHIERLMEESEEYDR